MAKRKTLTLLEMLKCRAYGHVWSDRGWISIIRQSVRGYDQEMTCDRCSATRTDFRARTTFKLINRWYSYPDFYPGRTKQSEALKLVILVQTQQMKESELEFAA